MSKAVSDLTERLLSLPVGRSCVASVRRADAYIRTVRKHAPDTQWRVEPVDGRWVITRVQ